MHPRVACTLLLLVACWQPEAGVAHPLRLSLCEIEHVSATGRLTISLRLFVMDVNEAIVFDPDSKALSLGLRDEAPNAEALLMNYLNRFFEVRANGEKIDLRIQSKRLKGEGDNTALAVEFEHTLDAPLDSLAVRNAVFTDLFFDQNNIVYVHVDDDSRSLMLSKNTPETELTY